MIQTGAGTTVVYTDIKGVDYYLPNAYYSDKIKPNQINDNNKYENTNSDNDNYDYPTPPDNDPDHKKDSKDYHLPISHHSPEKL